MKPHYDRRPRTSIMLAYPFEEKRLQKWSLPWLVQPKYNGLRCLAIRGSDYVELLSSTGFPIVTVPHIKEAMMKLPIGIYDGELYLHDNFQRLTHLVNRGMAIEGCREVSYVIFDLKNTHFQEVRLLMLTQLGLTFNTGIIRIAPSWACAGTEEVELILKEQTAQGFEGLILRAPDAYYQEKRATTMMKLKPRSSDTYRITGFLEEVSIQGELKGSLGAFTVADTDGRTFKVGSGFTAEQRRIYWREREKLVGCIVHVKYQALTDRGVPWFPVFMEVVR